MLVAIDTGSKHIVISDIQEDDLSELEEVINGLKRAKTFEEYDVRVLHYTQDNENYADLMFPMENVTMT